MTSIRRAAGRVVRDVALGVGAHTDPHDGLQPSFKKSTCPEKNDFQANFGHVTRGFPGPVAAGWDLVD